MVAQSGDWLLSGVGLSSFLSKGAQLLVTRQSRAEFVETAVAVLSGCRVRGPIVHCFIIATKAARHLRRSPDDQSDRQNKQNRPHFR